MGIAFAVFNNSGTMQVSSDLFINIVSGIAISFIAIYLINAEVNPSCPELFWHLSESISLATSYGYVGDRKMFRFDLFPM